MLVSASITLGAGFKISIMRLWMRHACTNLLIRYAYMNLLIHISNCSHKTRQNMV